MRLQKTLYESGKRVVPSHTCDLVSADRTFREAARPSQPNAKAAAAKAMQAGLHAGCVMQDLLANYTQGTLKKLVCVKQGITLAALSCHPTPFGCGRTTTSFCRGWSMEQEGDSGRWTDLCGWQHLD
mmetsp:Transcript_20304/g.36102  ORF Transcript_20304/g.36102 Transcript_20304/m.36102 type:complete len:127 (-) Transcript_20304:621-1001(-)